MAGYKRGYSAVCEDTAALESLLMANAGYARVATDEAPNGGGAAAKRSQRTISTPERHWTSPAQWFFLGVLTLAAGIILASKISSASTSFAAPLPVSVNSSTGQRIIPGRQRQQRWARLSMGRMGASSSFFLRSKRRKIRAHAAKAATRSVVLIGSHFEPGNALLKRVFGELCQRPKLALRCEPVWGGTHDLKSLAAHKAKHKKLVWLDSDASRLLETLRGVRSHASDYRLVHVLWDPLQACYAQWPKSVAADGGPNATLPDLCDKLRLSGKLLTLYRRAKRAGNMRALQPRIEDLISRRNGPAAWRQVSAAGRPVPCPRSCGAESFGGRHLRCLPFCLPSVPHLLLPFPCPGLQVFATAREERRPDCGGD